MPRPKKKLLGDKVREIREKRKLTQDELAKKAGLPTISVAKLETNAVKNPGIQAVTKVARALEASIDSIVEGLFLEKKDKSEK